jgi:hypothetical protein
MELIFCSQMAVVPIVLVPYPVAEPASFCGDSKTSGTQ